jgi:hypothetical protein
MSLVITKQSGNFFSLVIDSGEPIISEQNRLTTIGDFCNFKTASGANLILKQNVLYSDITLITNVTQVPTSVNNLWTILIAAGFFVGLGSTTGGGGVDRFDDLLDTFEYLGRDGQILVVDEAQLRIVTQTIDVFTAQDRTKLDGIQAEAEVNVQANWAEADPDSDAFILNKPTIGSFFNGIYKETFLNSNINTFTIPVGVQVLMIFIDRGLRYDTAEFTQVDTLVTILGDTLVNADVYITGLQ